jgi:hypothetical protein
MQNPTMLYKADGDVEVWGEMLQTLVVDADEVEGYLADGWVDHPHKVAQSPEPKTRLSKTK